MQKMSEFIRDCQELMQEFGDHLVMNDLEEAISVEFSDDTTPAFVVG